MARRAQSGAAFAPARLRVSGRDRVERTTVPGLLSPLCDLVTMRCQGLCDEIGRLQILAGEAEPNLNELRKVLERIGDESAKSHPLEVGKAIVLSLRNPGPRVVGDVAETSWHEVVRTIGWHVAGWLVMAAEPDEADSHLKGLWVAGKEFDVPWTSEIAQRFLELIRRDRGLREFDAQRIRCELKFEAAWTQERLRSQAAASTADAGPKSGPAAAAAGTGDLPEQSGGRGRKRSSAARPRGRKLGSDPSADKKIYDAWQTSRYTKYAELALSIGRRARDVELAIGRHRKRVDKRHDGARLGPE